MLTNRIVRIDRLALLAALGALSVGACQCQEPLQVLAPKIEIGDPYDPTFSVCEEDFVRNCAYDFNDVGIGRPKLFSFVIKNPSSVNLIIQSIAIEGSERFRIEGEIPALIEHQTGGVGKIVTVKYDPVEEISESARLVIVSDARNLEEGENVVIELSGRGKYLGAPSIEVSPGECDFGDVGVNIRAFCDLSINNTGTQELTIADVRFTAESPYPTVFGPESVFPIPTVVAPGTGTSIRFYGVPNVTGAITGALVLTSNDPVKPTVNVPFRIRGAQAPTAIARVKSINGAPNNQASPPVEPLDNVVLSGDQSVGQDGASITAYQWTIVEKPPESSATLSAPNAVDTGFRFSSAQGNVNGLDVAGTFVVRLEVTDSNGARSTNDARVTLNAVPTDGLHIQLTWSSDRNDIDLHLGRGNNPAWCTQDDCYYGNCTFTSPNWDGVPGVTAGDPSLDIDDLNGFGPENINIEVPVNGSYVIGVHAYGPSNFDPTDVTVKIFVGGALVQQLDGRLERSKDFWRVARIDVNGPTTIVPIDTMQSNFNCF
jgi:hypothetical protein